MSNQRGAMRNVVLATQERDYSGLRFGRITPTDIDGLIEYKEILYILIELKFSGGVMPDGQRIALERLTDDLATVKPSICFIAEHACQANVCIDAAKAIVVKYRYAQKWHVDKRGKTLYDAIKSFIDKIDENEVATR